MLKTEDQRDQICLSEVAWEVPSAHQGSQAVTDIQQAADSPLESALALRLNDLLWNVEKRSMDESMEEEDEW